MVITRLAFNLACGSELSVQYPEIPYSTNLLETVDHCRGDQTCVYCTNSEATGNGLAANLHSPTKLFSPTIYLNMKTFKMVLFSVC